MSREGASQFHLAQVNIGRLLAPIDSDEIADFANNLEPINALAEAAPGFVWRLKDDSGNATGIEVVADDPLLILNMSVWESPDALSDFVYRTQHAAFMRRRREWFEKFAASYLALWWVPVGTVPTVADATERLAHLDEHGPTDFAFTLKQRFDSPA